MVKEPRREEIVSVAENPITPLTDHSGEMDADTVEPRTGVPALVISVPVHVASGQFF